MSSDPSDLNPMPQASPGPSPTPSPNPMANTPQTTPVTTSSPSQTAPSANIGDPPAAFVAAVNNALMYRLGPTKYALIPAADKKALIDKIWHDPQLQAYFIQNQNNLKDPSVAGTLGVQINEVMMGQGNDPTVAVDYANMLQAAGVQLTTAEQAALAGATAAINAPVPRPFASNKVSGYDFGAPMPPGGWSSKAPGQSYGWQTHNGVDYGTTAGDRIVSPFAGTVVATTNVAGYGNIVYVQLDNGWVIGFGHVGSIAAQNGARVNPGDLIAIAGQNVGSAVGSVTIVTWQAPGGQWKNGVYTGKYANPHEVMDPIFAGATFSSLGAPGAAGTGMPSVNKVLDAEYPTIKNDWLTYFGTPPSPEDVYNVLNHGSTPQQWTDYIRSLPSHLGDLSLGQYHDLRTQADAVSTQVLGHPATDSIVLELQQKGITSQQAMTNWYNEHGVTGIPKSDYQDIYKAMKPTQASIFNEPAGADPRDIRNIYNLHKPPQIGPQVE
jgi:murein DD-endopeptidase MepM/ murein hydrolase activator NlpD